MKIRAKRSKRSLHRRFLFHPATLMVILLAGVLIAGWTYEVIADTIISSTIEAPSLQSGATITSPADGSATSTSPITVSGACPLNSYVKLYRNSGFSGVAWCTEAQTWQIVTDLFNGQNALLAQDYNATDEPGPTTAGIDVTYNPIISSSTNSSSSSSSVSSPSSPSSPRTTTKAPTETTNLPLLVISDFHYQTFSVNGNFSWSISIKGGRPPYDVLIDWGDKSTSSLPIPTDPTISIRHHYQSTGYFPIIVRSTDSTGASATLQLAALIQRPGTGIFNPTVSTPKASQGSGLSGFLENTKKWLWLAAPVYAVVVLMLISFWLGERTEYANIFSYHRSPKRLRH